MTQTVTTQWVELIMPGGAGPTGGVEVVYASHNQYNRECPLYLTEGPLHPILGVAERVEIATKGRRSYTEFDTKLWARVPYGQAVVVLSSGLVGVGALSAAQQNDLNKLPGIEAEVAALKAGETATTAQFAQIGLDQVAQNAAIAAGVTQAQFTALQTQVAGNVDTSITDLTRQADGSVAVSWEDGAQTVLPAAPTTAVDAKLALKADQTALDDEETARIEADARVNLAFNDTGAVKLVLTKNDGATVDVNLPLVNDLTTGGAKAFLSAQQGVVLRNLIEGIGERVRVDDLADMAADGGPDGTTFFVVNDTGTDEWGIYQRIGGADERIMGQVDLVDAFVRVLDATTSVSADDETPYLWSKTDTDARYASRQMLIPLPADRKPTAYRYYDITSDTTLDLTDVPATAGISYYFSLAPNVTLLGAQGGDLTNSGDNPETIHLRSNGTAGQVIQINGNSSNSGWAKSFTDPSAVALRVDGTPIKEGDLIRQLVTQGVHTAGVYRKTATGIVQEWSEPEAVVTPATTLLTDTVPSSVIGDYTDAATLGKTLTNGSVSGNAIAFHSVVAGNPRAWGIWDGLSRNNEFEIVIDLATWQAADALEILVQCVVGTAQTSALITIDKTGAVIANKASLEAVISASITGETTITNFTTVSDTDVMTVKFNAASTSLGAMSLKIGNISDATTTTRFEMIISRTEVAYDEAIYTFKTDNNVFSASDIEGWSFTAGTTGRNVRLKNGSGKKRVILPTPIARESVGNGDNLASGSYSNNPITFEPDQTRNATWTDFNFNNGGGAADGDIEYSIFKVYEFDENDRLRFYPVHEIHMSMGTGHYWNSNDWRVVVRKLS